ncbi:MAG: Flp pilus assembly complex ATPase component TadA, partial [Verrucomicrobiales bacterium]|nr:Flp pilus assembly complex ATPase component TadA [Verrucomicrobiales bacterium]
MSLVLDTDPPTTQEDSFTTGLTPQGGPAEATAEAQILSLEGLALQNGLLPIHLMRESCSPEAERVVRLLGRVPYVADPWLPVTTVGPLLVMAHHNPRSADLWGVPAPWVIRVVISLDQYQNVRKDLVQRFSHTPIAASNALDGVTPPRFSEDDYTGAFEWLIQNYPYDETERSRLLSFFHTAKEKASGNLEVSQFNGVQRHLGVALRAITTQGQTLCFNPADAHRQNHFPLPLLERHNVYPLYIGRSAVFLLSESMDCYAFEDEWMSLGHDPIRVVPVLADPAAIREALARAAATFNPSAVADIDGTDLSIPVDEHVVDIDAEAMATINPNNPNHTAEELLHWVLFTAIRCRASDLHIEKYYNVTRFRARMDGNMRTVLTASDSMLNRFIALVKNYAGMNQNRLECQDGRFALSVGRRRVDVRIAALPTRREFQKLVLRFLDKQDGVRRLSDFNLSQRQLGILGRVMSRDQGLMLVTGPTGS